MDAAIQIQKIKLPLNQLEPVPEDWYSHTFRKETLEELKASIRKFGVLEPILVRRIGDDRYQVLSGYNRIQACRELGADTIRAEIMEACSDQVAREIVCQLNPKKKCGYFDGRVESRIKGTPQNIGLPVHLL